MSPIREFIASGVLELYVLGAATPEEVREVERMAAAHPEVRQELNAASQALGDYALAHAVEPRNTVKALVLATIDYMERMKHGELPASPPRITSASRPEDFEPWLSRQDMELPVDADSVYAKIIGYTPAATTAIAWIRSASDFEVHHEEHESFLIVEGTCNMILGEKKYPLAAGDYFAVPLHTPHRVEVTSAAPCKAVMQRISIS
ncbi:cupin domain-containing protein [Pontibacter actiniarum]|uniref:Cupin type-2 domain-containing protein n=1 Tax=Pontibacter actiniarum TaxID=323450 RepID=A0A1X9YNV3_9BACT|nr:cupin domain-containing protein [Pontibacter actiniarum]ARS34566.1 hypothetical protein CA264_03405 [Pontibacter actiniarum]